MTGEPTEAHMTTSVFVIGNCDPETLNNSKLNFWPYCQSAMELSKLKINLDFVQQYVAST